jgi:hypothetical protein
MAKLTYVAGFKVEILVFLEKDFKNIKLLSVCLLY